MREYLFHGLLVMVSVLLLQPCFSNLSVFAQGTETEAEFDASAGVPADKVWTVHFNSFLDPASINSETVFVEDVDGNKMSIEPSVGSQEDRVIVNPPQEGYTPGEAYTLYIMNVKDHKGNTLKKQVSKSFMVDRLPTAIVEKNTAMKEIAMDSILSSSDMKVEEPGVKDGTIELTKEEGSGLSAGSIITVPPNDIYPEGLARKIETLEEVDGKIVVTTSVPYLEDVINQFDIYQPVPLTSEFIEPESLPDGVTVQDFKRYNRALGQFTQGLSYQFDNFSTTVKGKPVHLNGSIELQDPILKPDLKLNRFKTKVESFRFTLGATIVSQLTIEGEVGIEGAAEVSMPLGKARVPVPQVPGLTLDASINAFVSAGITGGVNATLFNKSQIEVGIIKNKDEYKAVRNFEGQTDVSTKSYTVLEAKVGVGVGISASFLLIEFLSATKSTGLYGNIKGTLYSEEGSQELACTASEAGIFIDLVFGIHLGPNLVRTIELIDRRFPLYEKDTCNSLQSLAFQEDTMELESGETKQTKVLATFFDLIESASSFEDVTKKVEFKSSDDAVSVSELGEVRVKRGEPEKDVTVQAVYKDGNTTKTATLLVEIKTPGINEGFLLNKNKIYKFGLWEGSNEYTFSHTSNGLDQWNVKYFDYGGVRDGIPILMYEDETGLYIDDVQELKYPVVLGQSWIKYPYPGHDVEDKMTIVGINETVETRTGIVFTNAVKVRGIDGLEGIAYHEYYVPGIGKVRASGETMDSPAHSWSLLEMRDK